MNVQELFNLGNDFYAEGRVETAMEIWNRIIRINPDFGPVYLNQHNVYRAQGNLVKAKEALVRFVNCPVTGVSIDAVPVIKAQIVELDKQINPQPPQVK